MSKDIVSGSARCTSQGHDGRRRRRRGRADGARRRRRAGGDGAAAAALITRTPTLGPLDMMSTLEGEGAMEKQMNFIV